MQIDRQSYLAKIAPAQGLAMNASYLQWHSDPGNRWRCVLAYRLSGAENQGNHHVYVDLIDQDRNFITRPAGILLGYSWVGQRPEERTPYPAFDKPDGEPGANVPIEKGMRVTVWVQDNTDTIAGTDMIANLHADLPDESPGNTWGHFSYYLIFMRMDGEAISIKDLPSSTTVVGQIRERWTEIGRLLDRLESQ